MRRIFISLSIIAAVLTLSASTFAASSPSVSFFLGTSWNAPVPILIHQDGYPDIRIDHPQWETRPLYEAPYYAIRFSWDQWALEVIHNKLYLVTDHPDVQQFWISHGYNLILAERLHDLGGWSYSLGGGVVLAHPETIIRGHELSDPPHAGISFTGYYLSGVAAEASVARRLPIKPWLSLTAETKLTGAWARVPIVGGYADVPDVAIHGLIGAELTW